MNEHAKIAPLANQIGAKLSIVPSALLTNLALTFSVQCPTHDGRQSLVDHTCDRGPYPIHVGLMNVADFNEVVVRAFVEHVSHFLAFFLAGSFVFGSMCVNTVSSEVASPIMN